MALCVPPKTPENFRKAFSQNNASCEQKLSTCRSAFKILTCSAYLKKGKTGKKINANMLIPTMLKQRLGKSFHLYDAFTRILRCLVFALFTIIIYIVGRTYVTFQKQNNIRTKTCKWSKRSFGCLTWWNFSNESLIDIVLYRRWAKFRIFSAPGIRNMYSFDIKNDSSTRAPSTSTFRRALFFPYVLQLNHSTSWHCTFAVWQEEN